MESYKLKNMHIVENSRNNNCFNIYTFILLNKMIRKSDSTQQKLHDDHGNTFPDIWKYKKIYICKKKYLHSKTTNKKHLIKGINFASLI